MSLELALQENTATMKALIAALAATGTAAASSATTVKQSAAQVAATASGPTTAKVVEAAAPASTTSEKTPAAASAETAAPASTAADPITYDQVAKAITDGVKADRAKVVAALAKFSAKKGTELKPEQYADFLAALA